MTRKTRLNKLEAETVERWHKAWEAHAALFDKHAGDFTDWDTLTAALLKAYPEKSGDELEASCVAFLEELGIKQYRAFAAWVYSFELPEVEPPDLTMWPSDIPMPPDELLGEWEKGAPYRKSDKPMKRLAAELYLFMLAMGRAVRVDRVSYRDG